MSKIEQLIKELCPGGVETLLLKDIASFRRGSFPQPYGNPDWYDGEGAMPFIQVADVEDFGFKVSKNTKRKISLSAQPMSVFAPKGTVLVTLQGTIGKVAINQYDCYVDRTLALFDGFKIEINKKYFAHQLESIFSEKKKHARGGIIKTITKEEFQNFSMQVPPLPIQQEIVRILDTFTEAQANLEQELELRKKQYEYYRNQLLTFDENVERVSFGNSFQLKARIGWQGLTKKEYRSSGEYKLVTGTDFTNNHTIDFSTCVYVDKERYDQDEYIQLKEDDVLITKDGTLGKVAYIDKLEFPTTLNGGVFVVRDLTGRVIQKFTKHYLCSYNFKSWMEMNHTSGSIQHLTQKLLVNFMIPVPSKERQQEIVSILDKFESAIQTLEEELALRKKQYEYYREKLLTFN